MINPDVLNQELSPDIIQVFDNILNSHYNFDTQTVALKNKFREQLALISMDVYNFAKTMVYLENNLDEYSNNGPYENTLRKAIKGIDELLAKRKFSVSDKNIYCYVTKR